MTVAPLALLALLGAGPDPSTLVARLGSDRYAEREAAAQALEQLGTEALTHLRVACKDTDPEIQNRAETLLERIESRMLTRPSLVRMDVRDLPISEIVRRIGRQTGFDLEAHVENDARLASRPVTVHEPDSIAFWDLIDRIGLAPDTDPLAWQFPEHLSRGALRLIPRPRFAVPPCIRGPFLISLRKPAPDGPEDLILNFELVAEPRLLIKPTSPIRLTEATDDEGRSLLPSLEFRRPGMYSARNLGEGTSSYASFAGRLRTSLPRSQSIRRLCGVVNLEISSRKTEPTVILLNPADRAVGRSFSDADNTFVLLAVRDELGRHEVSLDFLVVPHNALLDPFPMRGRRRFLPPDRFGVDRMLALIDVVDARGREFQLDRGYREIYDVNLNGRRIIMTLGSAAPAGPAAELRFHDVIRTTADVEFEFQDIPLR